MVVNASNKEHCAITKLCITSIHLCLHDKYMMYVYYILLETLHV